MKSADQNHGISLTPLQVRSIATFLVWLDSAAGNATRLADSTNNMLAAYMNEFGSELMDTLIADAEEENVVEGEVVEAETIYVDPLSPRELIAYEGDEVVVDDESKEDEGPSSETARLDAQNEGFNSEPISEDI